MFLHQGVIPNINLSMATGLEHRWDQKAHYWTPVTDATGKSSDEQIYIAGDGNGVGGAKAAAITGQLSASAIVARYGKPRFMAQLYYKLRHLHFLSIRPFLDRLYLPEVQFRIPKMMKQLSVDVNLLPKRISHRCPWQWCDKDQTS